MIGWLIKDQQVGLLYTHTCKSNPHALPSRKIGHWPLHHLMSDTKRSQLIPKLMFPHLGETLFQILEGCHANLLEHLCVVLPKASNPEVLVPCQLTIGRSK